MGSIADRGAICAALWLAAQAAAPAGAQSWLMIEARAIPSSCSDPIACIPQSRTLIRNLISLGRTDAAALLRNLNALSTIRGIPDTAAGISNATLVPLLAAQPMAEDLAPLVGLPGIHFDAGKLDEDPLTAGFAEHVRSQLAQAGIRLLTADELEEVPGRPTLSLRFAKRTESAGCIIPFSVSLSIREEVVMVRDPARKIGTTIWSSLVRENLANDNYTPGHALDEAIKRLIGDFRTANPD